MRCPDCGLENPEGGIHCDCGYNFSTGKKEAKRVASAGDADFGPREWLTPQSRLSVEMQLPVGDRRWLWAVRCSAFISFLITLALAFGGGDAELAFVRGAGWWILYLPLLFLLFFTYKWKGGLVFALGIGALMGFISLFFLALSKSIAPPEVLRFLSIGWPVSFRPGLREEWLFWLLFISSLMLGVTAVVAFTKIEREAGGTGRLRMAFGAGILCALLIYGSAVILLLLAMQAVRLN
jgi:hypothetical protein